METRAWKVLAAGIALAAIALMLSAHLISSGAKPRPEYKEYPPAGTIALPAPFDSGMPLGQAIAGRRSVREYSDSPVSLAQLSSLLHSAQGITHPDGYRSAPSAGGLYPLETYVFANKVEGAAAGIYHYNIKRHSLELLKGGDFSEELYLASFSQECVRNAAAVVIFSAVEGRVVKKYGEAGRGFVLMEAGHASQNLLLQAYALGLGAVPVGGFDGEDLDRLLGLDGKEERTIYLNAVGRKKG